MSHPPIPPNCERFHMYEGKMSFAAAGGTWYDGPYPFLVAIDELIKDAKHPRANGYEEYCLLDIAAVAEVAWLKEAERYFPYSSRSEQLAHGDFDKWNEAKANAALWRAWGAQASNPSAD